MSKYLPNFIGDVDQLGFLNANTTESERYRIHARNLLRHIIRGTGLVEKDGSSYSTSPLANDEIISSLLVKRKKELMNALRIELQAMMDKTFDWISDPHNGDATTRQQCEVFLNHILAIYPFIDPQPGEETHIPTKISGKWEKVPYIFEQIDISPIRGPLSWILEDEDKIYAYGLKSSVPGAKSLLLFMGTTYPGGQGSALADLYNFKPLHSVGEGHSFTRIGEWVEQQDDHDVIVTGHSKGATMAMIAAAKWPNKIKVAHCLNPAGLSGDTLERYKEHWVNTEDKPEIQVLINEGDIVPYLDTGFLPGTKIVRISHGADKLSFNFNFPSFLRFIAKGYEAHIHHFAGRANAKLEEVSLEEMNRTPARHVLNDIRWTVSWLLFPLQYLSLFITIIERKIARFYENKKLLINLCLLLLGAALAISLVLTGVAPILFGVASSYLLLLNLPISIVAVKAIATALISAFLAASPLITAWSAFTLLPLAKKALIGIGSGLAVVTGITIGTLVGFIRLGINKLFWEENEANKNETNLNKSPQRLVKSLEKSSDDSIRNCEDVDIKNYPSILTSSRKTQIIECNMSHYIYSSKF